MFDSVLIWAVIAVKVARIEITEIARETFKAEDKQ